MTTGQQTLYVSRVMSNFRPLHQPTNSPIPDLMDWIRRQPIDFQARMSTMPIEEFRKEFKPYCPNCKLDHRTMTPMIPLKGKCIQCQYFLATGKAGSAQKK